MMKSILLGLTTLTTLILMVATAGANPGADRRFDRNIGALDTALLDDGSEEMLERYIEDRRDISVRAWRSAATPGRRAVQCDWNDDYLAYAAIDTPAEVIFARALVTNKGRGSVDLGFEGFEMHAEGACPDEVTDGPVTFWMTWYQVSQAMEPAAVSDLEEARRMYEMSAVDSRMKLIMRFEGEFRDGRPDGRFTLTQVSHVPEMDGLRGGGAVATMAKGYADFEDGEFVRRLVITEMAHNATLAYLEQPETETHDMVMWVMHGAGMHMGDRYTVNEHGELDGWFVRMRGDEDPSEIRACVRGNLPAPRDRCTD